MDQTKRPLRIPPDFATYAEQHDVFALFEEMVKSLVIHQPENMLQHVKELLQRGQRKTIIVYGPPGVGKRAVARAIADKYNCIDVFADDVVTHAIKMGSEAGFKAKEYHDAGKPVPDDVVTECVVERLEQPDCMAKGWVMHGFPTTRQQATALQTAGHLCSHFVNLECPAAVVRERAVTWTVDSGTGAAYSEAWNPPPEYTQPTQLSYPNFDEALSQYDKNAMHVCESFSANARRIDASQSYDAVLAAVVDFLRTKQRSNAPVLPRVIFLGGPGTGKTTLAQTLAKKYAAVYVNAKDLITMAVSSRSKMGAALKPYVERGMMVPDNLFTKLMVERLWEEDCVTKGWVLDGFPLTRAQAEGLSKAGFVPNLVAFLQAPAQVCLDRLTLRRTDPVTGKRFHLATDPPTNEDVLERLKQHPDDEQDAVQKRMMDSQAFLAELQDFYSKGITVNAAQPVPDVLATVESHLVKPREPL